MVLMIMKVLKNDLYNWSKYLDDEGVILMHDTNVQDFGVRKLFSEIMLLLI